MAARKIPKNYMNVTGSVAHGPNSEQSGFESLLEKDYLLCLQFDSTVEHFEVQSIQVPVPGHRKPYTPDALVKYRAGPRGGRVKPDLVEVKPKDVLEHKAEDLAPKFKAATSFARALGWNFRVTTEEGIRTQRLENIKFLREFRRRPADPDREQAVIEALRSLGTDATSASVAQALEPSGDLERVAVWYPVIWRLVYERRIEIPIDMPMAQSVPMWIPTRGTP